MIPSAKDKDKDLRSNDVLEVTGIQINQNNNQYLQINIQSLLNSTAIEAAT